jgi:hypothetical protein
MSKHDCTRCTGWKDNYGCYASVNCVNAIIAGQKPLWFRDREDPTLKTTHFPPSPIADWKGKDIGVDDLQKAEANRERIYLGSRVEYFQHVEAVLRATPNDADLPKWLVEDRWFTLSLDHASSFCNPAGEG